MRAWPASLDEVERELRMPWRSRMGSTHGLREMVRVEVGLYLLENLGLAEDLPALAAVVSGYRLPLREGDDGDWSMRERQLTASGRHLLTYYKGGFAWGRAIESYSALAEDLRGYQIHEGRRLERRQPTLVSKRWDLYERTLSGPIPYAMEARPRVAGAGRYRAGAATVVIPKEVDLPTSGGKSGVKPSDRSRQPLTVKWMELLAVASEMDTISDGDWEQRLSGVRLELTGAGETFGVAEELRIDRQLHLAGIVSSGKSTLMQVLAYWAARNGLHVTLVVGTVIEALDRSTQFRQLGLAAVPVLGSARGVHLDRMHKFVARRSGAGPLEQNDRAFTYLSSACPLDALRISGERFTVGRTPCVELQSESDGKLYRCPFLSICPTHRAAQDMAGAALWITTAQALVSTRAPQQLSRERVRIAELVYRRSDLVIVDEADRVQVHLDAALAPGESLSGERSALEDELDSWIRQQLTNGLRGKYALREVRDWVITYRRFQAVVEELYGLLEENERAQRLVANDCFSEWTLYRRLAIRWRKPVADALGEPSGNLGGDDEGVRAILREFEPYQQAPFGPSDGPDEHDLVDLTRRVLEGRDSDETRAALARWISSLPGVDLHGLDPIEEADLLALALLVTVLATRLDVLLRMWPRIAEATGSDENRWRSFQRPPADYASLLPDAPMGNLLGFKYERSSEGVSRRLRYYRFAGLGRWLLIRFSELLAEEQVPGPHVLLLSGTSWAGSSPTFHLQAPVGGLLKSPPPEIEAIAQSSFEFHPVYERGSAIRISGLPRHARPRALTAMVRGLARPDGFGNPGLVEHILADTSIPELRRRLLVVVGSYDDAELVATELRQVLPNHGASVVHLVSDDEGQVELGVESSRRGLQRGDVERFVALGARILVAPLLAIERGFNIINPDGTAALAAALFLTRPLPRPDDLDFAIQSMNRWGIEHERGLPGPPGRPLSHRWMTYQHEGRRRWRELASLDMRYSVMEEARDAVTWNALVSIWQVVGRLVRGGCPASVYFCDASFMPELVTGTKRPGLLSEMASVLDRAFSLPDVRDREVAKALYQPLRSCLSRMKVPVT